MKIIFEEYVIALTFLSLSIILAFVLYGLSYLMGSQVTDPEKVSAYECGYDPFDDARSKFDVRFYLVAILFIIFDLEVTFFIPLGTDVRKIKPFWFLDYDSFFNYTYNWFCL